MHTTWVLMLAMQWLVDAGDEVVAVTPVWPNLVAQPEIMGARVKCVSLKPQAGAWVLDMEVLLAAITPQTRLLIVNSPNNPTGWTLTRQEQQQIVAHCRSTGTWILADEVYERLYYLPSDNACAPSFLDVCDPQDRLVVVHSFSKSLLVLPRGQLDAIGKLIEFNTSCAPVFVQRGAIEALARTDEITPGIVAHLQQCRDTLTPLLQAVPGVDLAAAPGGMYAFFRLAGSGDSLATAKRLVLEAGLGLAPGVAFGASDGDDAGCWLRWCFASRDPQRLVLGVDRLVIIRGLCQRATARVRSRSST